ncbi:MULTISPECIES: glycosyltransferase family 4 protein [unclassified Adlercreutzia]|uniref:glycosyltransferase family 4 protein n=1 Tax=unclassified Adlercreutzia TaxID=2636013 RepID=UPI0013EE2881|nr:MULTISPECIES: glycosyltransferase family 4 protein [unclassified Adlercreutzia]
MTKIVHLCLASFYVDNYSYQENLLPKYHKRLGFDVEIIASQQTFNEQGKTDYFPRGRREYVNENGIKVTRIDYKSKNPKTWAFRRFVGLYDELEKAAPNVLFIHNVQFLDMDKVVRYLKKNPSVRVIADNHADYSNSATNWISKYVLHGIIWKRTARMIEPFCEKFWGVLPARVDFLVENYGLPKNKCDLLVMGADDDEVNAVFADDFRLKKRESLGYSNADFVIVTGGKIDLYKRQTISLIDAVRDIGGNVKLLVFGPIIPELAGEVSLKIDGDRVTHIPWANTKESYELFSIADLVVFPGRHSVYWEQVVGMGKPVMVKRWAGTDHIDLGGNALFLDDCSAEGLRNAVKCLLNAPQKLNGMKQVAEIEGFRQFAYSSIARKSVSFDSSK